MLFIAKQSLVYALVKLFTVICNSLIPCYSFFGHYFYTTYKERLKSTLFSFERYSFQEERQSPPCPYVTLKGVPSWSLS